MLTDRCFQILEFLTEKWVKKYPAIREFRLYLGKDEERPYFLVIVPVDNISEEDLHSLYALVDGFSLDMLRELEHRALDFGCKFNIDQWGCDVDDGRPIPFIATDRYWLLYPKKDEMVEQDTPTDDIQDETIEQDLNGFSLKIIDLINEARPEIELIYKAIKEGEGFNNQGERYDEARMEAALYYFEENEDKFKIIQNEDLQNIDIFKMYSSQYSRKVKGGLLQKIIERHGFGRHAADKLFKEYQKKNN